MYSRIDLLNTLYQTLSKGDFGNNGNIYKEHGRPQNSLKEDIVVNIISLTINRPQKAVFNINVYLPDKKVKISGLDQTMPDFQRLNIIGKKIINYMENVYLEGISFYANTDTIIQDSETKEHYLNIKFDCNLYKID